MDMKDEQTWEIVKEDRSYCSGNIFKICIYLQFMKKDFFRPFVLNISAIDINLRIMHYSAASLRSCLSNKQHFVHEPCVFLSFRLSSTEPSLGNLFSFRFRFP